MNRRDFLRAVPGLALAALGLGAVAKAAQPMDDYVVSPVMRSLWDCYPHDRPPFVILAPLEREYSWDATFRWHTDMNKPLALPGDVTEEG